MKNLPAPPQQQNKTDWIRAAVTPEDRQALKQYASEKGVSESAAIRFILTLFLTSSFENSEVDAESVNKSLEAVE